jgi:class 3 adenylate cyclase
MALGEAGAGVISENLASTGALNAVTSGRSFLPPQAAHPPPLRKMRGVFGFCDIRRFDAIVDALGEGSIDLVNRVAALVHDAVRASGGVTNKNIGDAFLLVWAMASSEPGGKKKKKTASISADKVLKFAVQTACRARHDPTLAALVEDAGLGSKGGVEMGFGLHVGWAIEVGGGGGDF